ncbi:hypothetical protein QWT69_14960 [Sporosarcina oncorhynchi]|uniref:Aminoglycoside phosphotransferase domain-containing protein n=1 Tax=Sporosarcina oncorhynchi TaxID=3056444 RepID=A0ABZ0L3F7_9BACL|nr:hypothetical protein [Sporosarcina sp. T2O-4]WOV87144.1 hypothetical protein QWT69_14960 [Sporosarcina sp. T2O-4]
MIEEVLQQYFSNPPTATEVLRDQDRLVAEVTVDGKQYYVKGGKQSLVYIEKTITLTHLMREANLPFITPVQTLDGKYYVKHGQMHFILEQKGVGEEVKCLRMLHIEEIGRMLAKQHLVSENTAMRFGTGTSWGMFGGNATDALGDYDENELCFLDLMRTLKEHDQHVKEMIAIKELYEARRSILHTFWGKLPLGPVQGDFAPYNMLFQQHKMTAVFDYDIAGDEVLVNECIAIAIYLAWHYDYEGPETPDERYTAYIRAYSAERPLSNREQEAVPHLFALIRACRYDRIEAGIEKIKRGDGKPFLDETINILQG